MASEYTPNRRYPLYTDSDKPNLRDQYNGAIREIDADMAQALTDSSGVAAALGAGFDAQHTVRMAIDGKADSASLATEVSDRQSADSALSSRIDGVAGNLATEVSDRQAADSGLSSRIDGVAGNLENEVLARQSADGELSGLISQQSQSLNNLLMHRNPMFNDYATVFDVTDVPVPSGYHTQGLTFDSLGYMYVGYNNLQNTGDNAMICKYTGFSSNPNVLDTTLIASLVTNNDHFNSLNMLAENLIIGTNYNPSKNTFTTIPTDLSTYGTTDYKAISMLAAARIDNGGNIYLVQKTFGGSLVIRTMDGDGNLDPVVAFAAGVQNTNADQGCCANGLVFYELFSGETSQYIALQLPLGNFYSAPQYYGVTINEEAEDIAFFGNNMYMLGTSKIYRVVGIPTNIERNAVQYWERLRLTNISNLKHSDTLFNNLTGVYTTYEIPPLAVQSMGRQGLQLKAFIQSQSGGIMSVPMVANRARSTGGGQIDFVKNSVYGASIITVFYVLDLPDLTHRAQLQITNIFETFIAPNGTITHNTNANAQVSNLEIEAVFN